MANNRPFSRVFAGLALAGLCASGVLADGFIIPRPRPGEKMRPLSVKHHRVGVVIRDQVAKTVVDQVFINHHSRDIEGTFIFPLPVKAAISEFSMFVGDKEVKGEILDRDQARRVYEDIVRRLRDPALLEYVGRNMFRARIYPIPADGEKRIRLSYTEVLGAETRLVKYRYPLDTERFSHLPIPEVTVSVSIASRVPLTTIYSPSHKISVKKQSRYEARAGFEASDVKPDKDFILYFGLSEEEVGLTFLDWKSREDAYFMLLASPAYAEKREKVVNKNLIFVLDSSGSMRGTKIQQAKQAARFILQHLDKEDRFAVVDFDDGVELFAPELMAVTAENIEKALGFVEAIEDSGGTNINDALLEALRMTESGERPSYILFLTDGLPTVGITGTAEILGNIRKANTRSTRIVVFGVGDDVNTELLDRISLDNRGTSLYVSEEDNLEAAISNYYEKISSPMLSELTIEFSGIKVKDVYPRVLPDLFVGSQIVLVGRFQGQGPLTVTLSGKVKGQERRFVLADQPLTKGETNAFLERLWATRRIGFLLEEIRLHGAQDELVEEVKKLGLKFGIVTPYTSFLVTAKEREALDAAAPEAMEAFREKKVTGRGAVQIAKATQALKAQEQAAQVDSEQIKYRGEKTFYLKEGIWVDSVYVEGSPVEEILFNSPEYFRLLDEKPGIGKYLSVARNIIISYKGANYKIVE